MTQVSILEAERDIGALIDRALAGEEVIIARNHEPVVRLEIVRPGKPRRRIGGAAGLVRRMNEDFDAPLSDLEPYSR